MVPPPWILCRACHRYTFRGSLDLRRATSRLPCHEPFLILHGRTHSRDLGQADHRAGRPSDQRVWPPRACLWSMPIPTTVDDHIATKGVDRMLVGLVVNPIAAWEAAWAQGHRRRGDAGRGPPPGGRASRAGARARFLGRLGDAVQRVRWLTAGGSMGEDILREAFPQGAPSRWSTVLPPRGRRPRTRARPARPSSRGARPPSCSAAGTGRPATCTRPWARGAPCSACPRGQDVLGRVRALARGRGRGAAAAARGRGRGGRGRGRGRRRGGLPRREAGGAAARHRARGARAPARPGHEVRDGPLGGGRLPGGHRQVRGGAPARARGHARRLGAGTTVEAVARALGIAKTPLGVDVVDVAKGTVVATDASEAGLLEALGSTGAPRSSS